MTMPETIIAVENLFKDYAGTKAVKGINLDILEGEFFGLLGPNGAGKTTTISMLTGLLKPSAGRITIDGLDIASRPGEAKASLGLVPQSFAFYPTLPARDNLIFYGRLYGLRGRHLRERILQTLEMVGLSDRLDHVVATFSNGMKRRLNIAIALLHQPAILVLDEPTVGVDTQSRIAILENLSELKKSGVTVLYTTHYIEEAERFCDRVAILDHGCIIALDTPTALVQALGKDIIRMEFHEAVDSELLIQLGGFGSIKIVDRQKRKIHLQTAQTEEALMRTLALREGRSNLFRTIDILEPNLETVFIHLTGRELRE
jgi:ABC-2 type transport system ATP-binding protein